MQARLGVVLLPFLTASCGGARPTEPSRPSPAVAAFATPAPPASPAASNAAPTISGDDRCIGRLGTDHVFDMVLGDADGDAVSWEAEKDHAQGRLHTTKGGPVPAGTSVTLVYSPPGHADENWITLTATDVRGAITRKRLYVKNS